MKGIMLGGSATDISKPEKYSQLKSLSNAEHLQIVPLNVENKNQMKEFVTGCDIVAHGVTPFQLDVKDPKIETFNLLA